MKFTLARPDVKRASPRPNRMPAIAMLSKAAEYRENAAICAELEAQATERPKRKRYQRMKEAWLALAEEAEWLDGEIMKPERK